MSDIKLPAGYEDWVEVSPTPEGEYVKVEVIHWTPLGRGGHAGMPIEKLRYFVPPKPKLPDVKPGAVIRYVDVLGRQCRAAKLEDMCRNSWRVFTSRKTGVDSIELTADELLNDVNADGFTVELEGL